MPDYNIPEGQSSSFEEGHDFSISIDNPSIERMPDGYDTWKILPCRPREMEWINSKGQKETRKAKSAWTPHGVYDASNDPRQIAAWKKKFPDAMWGVATGGANGFFVLDLDRHPGQPDGVKSFDDYCRRNGYELPLTLTAITAGGGLHHYFLILEGVEIKTRGDVLPGVETRSTGSYAVIPPSVNSDGGRYKWVDPSVPIAVPPEWLVKLIQESKTTQPKNTQSPPNAAGKKKERQTGGDSPYGLKALEDEIAKLKDTPEGDRNNQLNVSAVKIFALVKGNELETANAYHALETAALKIGLTPSETRATLQSAWRGATPRTAPDTASSTKSAEDAPWPELVPFSLSTLPKVTPDMMPPRFYEYCSALAEEKQVPLELTVSLALSAVATAAQGGYKVQIHPDYTETTNVFTICPLPPGERKSSVCSAVKAPLLEWEEEQEGESAPKIRANASKRKTFEQRIDQRRKDAAKAKAEDVEAIQAEIESLEADLPPILVPPRLLVNDITPEALAIVMAFHGEKAALISAEGGIFDLLGGMYNGGVANLDLVLHAWGEENHTVDRTKSTPIFLKHPVLTLGLAPQPFTLMERTSARAFRKRGFDGRFLYFLPESRLGFRKERPPLMDDSLKEWFKNKIKSLLPTDPACGFNAAPPPRFTLMLSEDADNNNDAVHEWEVFFQLVEKELRPDVGEFCEMTDWAGKLPGSVARIAALYHLMDSDNPEGEKISFANMRRACLLGRLLAEHAKAAYALMGFDEKLGGAQTLLKWIIKRGKDKNTFTTRDAWRGKRGTFNHMPALKDALNELVDRGYLREVAAPDRQGPGRRPEPSYIVNPAVWG